MNAPTSGAHAHAAGSPAPAEESTLRTLAIAVAVALVCSALVTAAVQQLRPVQAAYAAIERNRAIVIAAGLATPDASDADVVDAFLALDARVLDLETGLPTDRFDPRSFDAWSATGEIASRFLPVYLARRDGRCERIVVPIGGSGMWSTIYGYLALAPDLDTVAALVIHEHGETPGIGDRIESPAWLDGWVGKRLRDDDGNLRLDVGADAASTPAVHRVDAITGATVTSKAVGRIVRERFGAPEVGRALGDLRAGWCGSNPEAGS